MKMMRSARLGLFLLVLHLLSAQVVQAQNTTDAPMNSTMSNYTVTPTMMVNVTSKDKNSCGRMDDSTLLLLPLVVSASLLYDWSQ